MMQSTTAKSTKRTVPDADRVLMLMALGLDPSFDHSDHELQCAWRRRIQQVHPDHGGNAIEAAAVNMSYMSLISHIVMPTPVDLVL